MRVPRAKRIAIPRIGPPEPPQGGTVRPAKLRDTCPIEFVQENPKQPGTKVYALYEEYKKAATVRQACELDATRPTIKYDIAKGYSRLLDAPAVVACVCRRSWRLLCDAHGCFMMCSCICDLG